jgi:hypothetical protein
MARALIVLLHSVSSAPSVATEIATEITELTKNAYEIHYPKHRCRS